MGPFRREPNDAAMRRNERVRMVKQMSDYRVTREFVEILLASYRGDVPAQQRLGELFREFPDEEG